MEEDIYFPDLQQVLETATTMDEVWEEYIKTLRANPSLTNFLYANKLEEFRNMLAMPKLRELEREFNEVKEHLRKIARDYGIKIRLTRRQKDFIGLNEKIRLFLLKNSPLDKINDFLGFRIILCTESEDNPQTVKLCYEVLNKLIEYFVIERGCLLTEAEPILKDAYVTSEASKVVIPQTNMMLPGFETNVKDYIRNPKANGYQSLHTIVRKTDGLVFEIQIRTLAMDIRAEYGSANHLPYKTTKYKGADIELDLTKLSIRGFHASKDGDVCDMVCLVKSGDPFNLL